MADYEYEKIGDGLAIYKRDRSPFWWVRVRIDDHPSVKEIRKSTKTTDKYDAIFFAKKLSMETDIKIESNIDILERKPPVWKVAERTIERIRNKKPFKPTYNAYIRILEKQIYPYFKEKNLKIDELTFTEIEEYLEHVNKKSQTEINITKTSFKHIFQQALRDKVLKERDVPKTLPKIKRAEERTIRNHFTPDELASVIFHLKEFIEESRKYISKENRFLLYCYIYFLLGSGARPGYECDITFNDLVLEEINKVKILTCKISKGKTSYKQRTIVLDTQCFHGLELAYAYHKNPDNVMNSSSSPSPFFPTDIQYSTDVDIIRDLKEIQNEMGNTYIFRRNDNIEPEYPRVFEQYVKWLIKKNKLSKNKNQTLYSFRHTYISEKLLNDNSWTAEQIATQCGNSLQMIWQFYNHIKATDSAFNYDFYRKQKEEAEEKSKDEMENWDKVFNKK